MENNPKWILDVQLKTGRTKAGRYIGPTLKQQIQDTLDDPELSFDKLEECVNCGLVLRSEFFAGGCPNCKFKGEMKRFGEQPKIEKE